MVLKRTLLLAGLVLSVASQAAAFVLLSGPIEARLPADETEPNINFVLSDHPPAITGRGDFAGGQYQDLGDSEFWLVLVQEAMRQWNEVNGSYLRLNVAFGDATLDTEDHIHSIVASSTSYTSSAYAQPKLSGSFIEDCDIAASDRTTDADDLAFTLMHELGHCLGLGHNHSDYKAAMGYSRPDRSLQLGLDDKAGLLYLYPDSSVSTAKELIHCGTLGSGAPASTAWLCWLYALPLLGLCWRLRRGRTSSL